MTLIGNLCKKETNYVGEDDDGDCLEYYDTSSQRDTNDNGNECDIIVTVDSMNSTVVIESLILELMRILMKTSMEKKPGIEPSFLESESSVLFTCLAIFLPLFLATGLIREEMSEGTIHMLAKPIARGEVLLYRMLGYIGSNVAVHSCSLHRIMSNHRIHWSGRGVIQMVRCSSLDVNRLGCHAGFFGVWYHILWIWNIWKNGVILAIILQHGN